MGNPVTWFEINSSNPSSLHEFYSRAFGWKMQPVAGMDSAMVDTDSAAGIAGSIGEGRRTEPGHLLHRGRRPAVAPRPSGVARRKDRRAGH